MKWPTVLLALAICIFATTSRADSVIASAQQKLKEQGFYYGEITGQKDADTAAAIRRFQIRNGLKINGELNDETAKSLGVRGTVATQATPPPAPIRAATPRPTIRATPPPDNSDLREELPRPRYGAAPPHDFAPAPLGVLAGTPYETSPLEVQRRIVVAAQSALARRGFYRGTLDGVYGQGMAYAVRAFQSAFGIEPTGRLDSDTLGALGLLPGQAAPGVTVPRYRGYRRAPQMFTPDGERIYIPR
ncbi:MAG TPA: peptidoglycan-binding protein [Chthoniobacterales bacterium]|jgi:peptidoglycan hydrolase-like protein with peptidoglycan-binding domain